MAQGADFRSRITLEGGDKIVTDLQKIGTEGDKAFSQVGKAADASTSQVNSFAKATEGMARQMANLRSATSKAGQDLAQIGKHASDFGGELRNVANNVIPGFKEVLGLATVGGIAGFFKLFENTAKWAHELEENSKLLGLTPGQFGLIAKAAKEAGIDVDVLAKGMLRFGNAMEKAGEERQKLFGELAKDVLGAKTAVSQAGVDIMRGGLKPGEQPKGPQARMIEVPRLDNFKQQAEEAYASLRALNAIPKTVTLENWLSQISKKLMEGGNAAAKVREDLNKIGANLPVTKLGEQIDQGPLCPAQRWAVRQGDRCPSSPDRHVRGLPRQVQAPSPDRADLAGHEDHGSRRARPDPDHEGGSGGIAQVLRCGAGGRR
jgi:hypothetical protein